MSSLTFHSDYRSLTFDCEYSFREDPMTFAYYNFVEFNFKLTHHVWREEQEILIRSRTYEGEVPMYMSSHEFFEDGLTYLRMNIPQRAMPDDLLEMIMRQVASSVSRFVDTCRRNCYALWPDAPSSTLHVDLDIIIHSLTTENEAVGNSELNQNEALDRILMESMDEIRMVPASQEAIGSLTNANLEIKDHHEKDCRICLDEFEDGMEVSVMPCGHVYHQQCIRQWLETSHMCPLCRYEMPV